MPVTLLTSISTLPTCGVSGSIEVHPSHLTIYAPEDKLKEVESLLTETLTAFDLKDTLNATLRLKKIEGVKIVPDVVRVVVPVEPFTEKSVEVPIEGVGVPMGYKMRIFPVKTNVVCRVAISKYDQVNSLDFKLRVDYNSAKAESNHKYPVRLVHSPKYVSNVRFQPAEVEILMEDEQ